MLQCFCHHRGSLCAFAVSGYIVGGIGGEVGDTGIRQQRVWTIGGYHSFLPPPHTERLQSHHSCSSSRSRLKHTRRTRDPGHRRRFTLTWPEAKRARGDNTLGSYWGPPQLPARLPPRIVGYILSDSGAREVAEGRGRCANRYRHGYSTLPHSASTRHKV